MNEYGSSSSSSSGFHQGSSLIVCKLNKSLYGLKQAPRAWVSKLALTLTHLGFTCAKSDNSLFIRYTPTFFLYLLAYVDHIILTGSSPKEIADVTSLLHSHFALKDLGDLHYFLGIHVIKQPHGKLLLT